jgi:Concanavalin A-like lectin/glucanases superfamily
MEARLLPQHWRYLLIALAVLTGCIRPNPAFLAGSDAARDRGSGLDHAPADQAVADQTAAADWIAADQAPVVDRVSDQAPPEAGPAMADLRTGLVGYWQMNDPSGSLAATDGVGGLSQRAVLESVDPSTVWVPMGRFESALEMPPANRAAGLRVESTSAIDGLFHYTLAAWIWRTGLTSVSSYEFIISRQAGNTDYEVFGLMVHQDRLRAFAPHSEPFTAADVVAPTTLPTGTWVHVAVTYDGRTLTLYQDAEVADTLIHPLTALAPTNRPLYIGTNKNVQVDRAEPFVGLLDEVLLYSVALGPGQIQALRQGLRP